jgi:hypothetical protein
MVTTMTPSKDAGGYHLLFALTFSKVLGKETMMMMTSSPKPEIFRRVARSTP